jgi:Ca-activated chloride channel homolog
MKVRAGQHRKSTSLFILGALVLLSLTSLLKARTNIDQLLSANRFPDSQLARLGSSVSLKESYAQHDGPVTINADLVTLTVSVTDASGRSVTGLDKRAFTILDQKSLQEIGFFSDADAPISIGIVFDLSGSMSGEKIRRAREALGHFMETSLDSDEYSLIVFNEQAQLLLERTRDSKAVLEKLSAANPQGATAMYDACYLGVDRLTRGTYPKRVLLLISDGQDNNSRYKFDEVRRLLRESDVVLYSIGIAAPIQLTGKAGARVRHTLEGLAGITGGKAFYPSKSSEMYEVFEQIALELRHQYSIGYRPQKFLRDGRWHTIKVKVNAPAGTAHLHVRSRTGYYAINDLGEKER